MSDPLPLGHSVTLKGGLTDEVCPPTPFKPSDTGLPDKGQTNTWRVPVSITNRVTDTTSLLVTSPGFPADGATCADLFDTERLCDQLFALDRSLPSGKTLTNALAFQCPSTGVAEWGILPDCLPSSSVTHPLQSRKVSL